MVICLERGADLHMAQLIPLSLTVSCFNKIQLDFTFPVTAHPGSPGKNGRYTCLSLHTMLFLVEKVYDNCISLALSGSVHGSFVCFSLNKSTA